jgi:hypothetical protein
LQNEFHRPSPINARSPFEKERKVKNWLKTNPQLASVIAPRATSGNLRIEGVLVFA